MAGIQTRIADGRGGYRELTVHDAEYWEGPYTHQPFPKAVYQATAGAGYQTPACRIVKSQQEWDALGPSWVESPASAREDADAQEAEYARIAAQRAYEDQRMSARALAEALTIERGTDAMLPAIPEQPRRGRPKKPVAETTQE